MSGGEYEQNAEKNCPGCIFTVEIGRERLVWTAVGRHSGAVEPRGTRRAAAFCLHDPTFASIAFLRTWRTFLLVLVVVAKCVIFSAVDIHMLVWCM